MESRAAVCPWCQAPRDPGPSCPKCGANYAKAEAIKLQGRAAASPPAPVAAIPVPEPAVLPVEDEARVDDPELEWKFCIGALPAMLLLGLAFHVATPFLQRTFLAMPVHELGHAVSAWLCGYSAIPFVWKTFVPEERGFVVPLILAGGAAYLMFRAWQAEKPLLAGAGAGVLLLQLLGTFGIKAKTAQMLITFGGDGMGMILAGALMASFFFGKGTQLYRGSLRWGLVAIGAAAFVDMFTVWIAARRDYGAIPFGEQEGGLLSDATKLVDDHNWTADQLVNRYVTLGVFCLLALAAVYGWGVWQASLARKKT